MPEWNNRDYTHTAIVEELTLLERHVRDGSYLECNCNPEKHLPLIAGLASEGGAFALSNAEKQFFNKLADTAREARHRITEQHWGGRSEAKNMVYARCIAKGGTPKKCRARVK